MTWSFISRKSKQARQSFISDLPPALDIPILFGGALFTETIFSWPGMGRLFFRSAQRVDYAVLMGIIMINAVLIVTANLTADILYRTLDPRVRYN